MSPFSLLLHQLRMKSRIRQAELARLVGYEQSYISALEVGVKGPPTSDFVDRLVTALRLSDVDEAVLRAAVEASQRKLTLDEDAPPDIYWMFKELRDQLPALSEVQIRLIRDVLRLKDPLNAKPEQPLRRLRRKSSEEAQM